MNLLRNFNLGALCLLIVLASQVLSFAENKNHPVSVTHVYGYVTRNAVEVKIEVFLEDLFLFHNLKPNDQDFLEPDIIGNGIELHKEFLLEKFVIRDLAGERLRGQIVEIEELDLLPEGVALGELMAHTLVFRIRYDLPLPPEFLTVSQHFTDEDGLIPSEMNLVMKQENAGDAHTATLKPNEPDTIRFNWDAPPLSAEASEEEKKKWEAKQKEETLGITSYSSVYSFLYIDGYEVRHEILIPLLTLEESILIARDDDEFLDIPEQDAARQQIEAFFATGNPIEIDGVPVKPTVDRCDFFGLNFKDFAKQAERKRVSLASARVGIILSYKTESTPNNLGLTWNRFNNYIWTINMVIFAFDEISKTTLSRLDSSNTYRWENPGEPELPPVLPVVAELPAEPKWSLPVATLGCILACPLILLMIRLLAPSPKSFGIVFILALVGSIVGWPFFRWEVTQPFYTPPPIVGTEANSIFSALHENVYRAFDYRREEDIYDALAVSIDGELLEDIYLQIRKGLEMQEQGGAISKIAEVEILKGNMLTPEEAQQEHDDSGHSRRFTYKGLWNVAGTVEHWGHIHARTNQYEARFEIETRENTWKITSLDLLAEERVSFETSLRGL